MSWPLQDSSAQVNKTFTIMEDYVCIYPNFLQRFHLLWPNAQKMWAWAPAPYASVSEILQAWPATLILLTQQRPSIQHSMLLSPVQFAMDDGRGRRHVGMVPALARPRRKKHGQHFSPLRPQLWVPLQVAAMIKVSWACQLGCCLPGTAEARKSAAGGACHNSTGTECIMSCPRSSLHGPCSLFIWVWWSVNSQTCVLVNVAACKYSSD